MNSTPTLLPATDIASHIAWFKAYAARERTKEQGDAAPMDLKLRHSMAVLENARHTAEGERFDSRCVRTCLLAALYHDVARFEQYLRYHTFRDKDSCDHGQLGVRILKRERRLVEEPTEARRTIMAAVGLHNRFALPPRTPHGVALVTNVVRDADKLDILRIMDEHLSGPGPHNPTVVLHQPDDPTIASEAVLRAVREGRVAAYADLRCVNDFRLLLGTWFFDLHFDATRKKFLADGHAKNLLRGIADAAPQAATRDIMLRILEQAR